LTRLTEYAASGGCASKLAAGPYAEDALVPATPWLGANPPAPPRLMRDKSGRIEILPAIGEAAARYAVWRQTPGGGWRFSVQPAGATVIDAAADENVVVTAVDCLGNESARVTLAGGTVRR
jgi:hypothetical protein